MTSELLALIAAHFACTNIAIQRPMTLDEARHCAGVYQEVKLAFVPGVDADAYAGLSHRERFAVSQAGYLAYRNWHSANPDTVRHLKHVARGEAELRTAG